MKARWVQSCSVYSCLLCFLFRYGGRCSEQLPSVVWDPWNPLFRCEDPVIKVKISNLISFVCPVYGLRPYLENYLYANHQIYESLYFVDDNFTAYHTCDAKNYVNKKFLNCDGQSTEYYRLSFRETSANSLIPDMVKGRTYYFIGTGYRDKENLGQLVGGSCSKTEDGKQGQGKLRLKVYICKDNEPCDLCPTAGCYYKECMWTCSMWQNDTLTKANNICTRVKKRSCTSHLLGETRIEYDNTEVGCGVLHCSNWTKIGERKNETDEKDCREIKARNCTNSLLGEEKLEIDDTKPCLRASYAVGYVEKKSDDTKFYIAIGTTILFFFVGIAIGVLAFKRHHSRHCCSKTNVAHNDGKNLLYRLKAFYDRMLRKV